MENEFFEEVDVEIIPDKSILPKIGYVNFTPAQAFAEFIDNSIDAKYNEKTDGVIIPEKIVIKILIQKDRIVIEDNSSGIENLQEALRAGSSFKIEKLGAFGLGLKTACMNLGKKFTIITKYISKEYGEATTIDTESEEWRNDKNWKARIKKFRDEKDKHYTKIIIERLHLVIGLYKDTEILEEIAFRFSEFLKNNEIEILFNKNKAIPPKIEFIDPAEFKKIIEEMKLDKNKFSDSKKEFEFYITTQGKTVRIFGWVNLLNKWSAGGRYGINIYRGGRLIESFKKGVGGIQNNPRHSRIIGHLYLPNDFSVTFTKDGFLPGRIAWKELDEGLKKELENYLKICNWLSQKVRIPSIKKQTINKVEKFLKMLPDAIKKSEELKKLFRNEETKKSKKGILKDGDIEKRKPKVNSSFKKPIPRGERIRNPKLKKQKGKSFFITISGFKIKINHDFRDIEAPPIKMYYHYYDENKKELLVITNTYFDSWGITSDESFYAAMNIISSLAEFMNSQKEMQVMSLKEIEEELWRCVGKEAYRIAI